MIRWDTCRKDFAWDGALRDIYVHGTKIDDWQTLLDALRGRYSLEYFVDDRPQPVPTAVDESFEVRKVASPTLRLRAGCITIISHFFTVDEIEFDIDPREVTSQSSLNELLGFIRQVGDTLCKTVIVSYENAPQHAFITYEPSESEFQYHAT